MSGKVLSSSFKISSDIPVKDWMNVPVTKESENKKKLRRRRNKVVVHPIFLEASRVIEDQYWKDVLTNASYGKLPRHFFYRDGVLTYKRSTKNFDYIVPDNPYEAASGCIHFFQDKGGLFSSLDQERSKEETKRWMRLERGMEDDWKKIPESMKKVLLDLYVEEMVKKHNLSPEEEKNLVQIVYLGLCLNLFSDITVEKKRITKIEGLLFDSVNRIFHLDSNIESKLKKPVKNNFEDEEISEDYPQEMVPEILSHWVKFAQYNNSSKKGLYSIPAPRIKITGEDSENISSHDSVSTFTTSASGG